MKSQPRQPELLEASAWCRPLFDVGNPESSLRSPQLRPAVIDQAKNGILPSDENLWKASVDTLVTKRRKLLAASPRQASVATGPPGRVLTYRPADNLFDGAADVASNGYFDINNCPPWDSWIEFRDGLLYAWVPEGALPLVQDGIDVNPEECIRWAD